MDWLMPQFGSSYMGALFLALLLVPNLLWTKNRPGDYDPKGENKALQALERAAGGGRGFHGFLRGLLAPGKARKIMLDKGRGY